MTSAATPVPGEIPAGFEVAPAAIPLGVRCRSCGRLHLPARLWPLAIRSLPGGGSEIELRCVRCHTAGTLVLDGEQPEDRGLLALWRDQAPDDGSARTPS